MSEHNKKDVKSTNEKVEELRDTVSSIDENHNTNKESENIEMSSYVDNEPDVIIETSHESVSNEEVLSDAEKFGIEFEQEQNDKELSCKNVPSDIEGGLYKDFLSKNTLDSIEMITSQETYYEDGQLSSEEDNIREDFIRNYVKVYTESKLNFVVSHITLGKKLVELKRKLKSRFFNVIDEQVFPKKQVHRLMKLVLKHDVDFKSGMKHTCSHEVELNNLKLLELDSRVTDLVKKDLSKFFDISINKINKMKFLNDEDFEKVVSGDDQPYSDFLEKQKKENKKISDEEHYKKKSNNISKEKFDELHKKTKYELIDYSLDKDSKISKLKDKNEKKDKRIKELEIHLQSRELELSMLKGRVDVLKEITLNNRQFKVSESISPNQSELLLQSAAS